MSRVERQATPAHGPPAHGGAAAPVVAAKVRVPPAGGLSRERLEARIDTLWTERLLLIVAPAGSGKTTLLAQLAARAQTPVAWYRAESWDSDVGQLLRHLEAAVREAIGERPGAPWAGVEDAARALDGWEGGRVLLVVDDLHSLAGTPAVAALERLIDYLPPSFALIAASRTQPDMNLPRRRVAGRLVEIDGDDLRFRSWEVERLFTDVYRQPRPPEELAELARRTEGWAAGLQLFHLATAGRPSAERRRLLAALGNRSGVMREYLASNVLGQLPAELRQFLVATSALGRLSGPLCDRLLNRVGSHDLLAELERRQIFTSAVDDGVWRYHEVLRRHLEEVLADELGPVAARAHYRRAGILVESEGDVTEALRAYCRAEDWQAVERLVGREGKVLALRAGMWMDALPGALVDHDPWLMLASARRLRADGRWVEAVARYGRAETTFGGTEAGLICREERRALAVWLDPQPSSGPEWWSLLRGAVGRDPLSAARDLAAHPSAAAQLAAALAGLAGGNLRAAFDRLEAVVALDGPDQGAPPVAAQLTQAVTAALLGHGEAAACLHEAVDACERAGAGWLAGVGRAALVLVGGEAPVASTSGQGDGSAWAAALGGLAAGWAEVARGEAPVEGLAEVAAAFDALGASVLAIWAQSLRCLALARRGHAEARQEAHRVDARARAAGVPGPRLYCWTVLAALEPPGPADWAARSRRLAASAGLPLPSLEPLPDSVAAADGSAGVAPIRVRLLGGFRIELRGNSVDLGGVKPRVRVLLRLLAAATGRAVHREVIQDALWPEADPETGVRNLQVAISSLRQLLEPGVARGASEFIVREGDAYRLALPPGSVVDLLAFEAAVAAARGASTAGDRNATIRHLEHALDLATGDPLVEDGPCDWAVSVRERYRHQAVEVARRLAELLLEAGDPGSAAAAIAAGLERDRCSDPLWRLAIIARERAGDQVAAARARREYADVLDQLGLGPGTTAAS